MTTKVAKKRTSRARPARSAKTTKAVIEVGSAIIQRDGRYLVSQRPEGSHLGQVWEFPGGKIDHSETHAQALRREIREELDVDVDVGELMYYTAHDYGDRGVTLYFYRCSLRGTPRPLLGQEMRWVPRAELTTLGFPPADDEFIARLAAE